VLDATLKDYLSTRMGRPRSFTLIQFSVIV
jgi:hypothetical protein